MLLPVITAIRRSLSGTKVAATTSDLYSADWVLRETGSECAAGAFLDKSNISLCLALFPTRCVWSDIQPNTCTRTCTHINHTHTGIRTLYLCACIYHAQGTIEDCPHISRYTITYSTDGLNTEYRHRLSNCWPLYSTAHTHVHTRVHPSHEWQSVWSHYNMGRPAQSHTLWSGWSQTATTGSLITGCLWDWNWTICLVSTVCIVSAWH